MCTPRNLVLLTLSTAEPLITSGAAGCELSRSRYLFFSFFFFTFKEKLFSLHHMASCFTSLLWSFWSLLLMSSTAVVSSVNLMKRLML